VVSVEDTCVSVCACVVLQLWGEEVDEEGEVTGIRQGVCRSTFKTLSVECYSQTSIRLTVFNVLLSFCIHCLLLF